ncbi:MAG: hypothetical protein ICV79_08220, partial [Flavisolibacter sp.]|nr:hypothetical protein [Flavisolibacter sp.]
MRTNFLLAATLVVAIFLAHCNRNFVLLDYTNAKGEVPRLGNLIFRFNKPLIADSLTNNWDSTEYISFEPDIPGRFRWDGSDQLIFSPARPLAPATTYKAKVRKNVLRYSEFDKVKDGDNISFHTAPLQLDDAQVTWVLQEERGRVAVPQVNLAFNYAVKPEAVKEKLSIEVEGKKWDYTIQNISAGNEVAVRLNGFKAEDKNYEAKVLIEKGLLPQDGKNSTTEPLQTTLSIPSPYTLTINNVEAQHDGMEGTVHISTSQQLTGENLSSLIKFEPAVNYTVEYDEYGVVLRSDKFNPEKSYALTIQRGLRGKVGGVLREEYNGAVAFGAIEAGIKFTNNKAVYLSKNGSGNMEVRITNVPKVKLIISKIYENNLLMASRYGYYPKDDENEEAEYASYSEEGNNYIDAVLGDVVYAKELDVRSLPKSGAGRILNISQFADRLPEAKGIYHVKIRSTQDYWVEDSRFISLSDLGL